MIKEYLKYKKAKKLLEKYKNLGSFWKVKIEDDGSYGSPSLEFNYHWYNLDNAKLNSIVNDLLKENVEFSIYVAGEKKKYVSIHCKVQIL